MYQLTHGKFHTPRGRLVEMAYREDTSDWNTLNACMSEDEYGLKGLDLTGTALDVGAHIGGVTIGLALDNPSLEVIAIEAVPPNVDLLRENVEHNGLSDRVTVLHMAAGKGETAEVSWAFKGDEVASHHAFIGNAQMPELTTVDRLTDSIPVITLAQAAKRYGPFSFCKIDCELCEFRFLTGRGLRDIALIRGEVHADPTELDDALAPTHDVTWPAQLPGAFEAVRRA